VRDGDSGRASGPGRGGRSGRASKPPSSRSRYATACRAATRPSWRLERALPVARNGELDLAYLGQDRLRACAVQRVTAVATLRRMLRVGEVILHLDVERRLQHRLRQTRQQPRTPSLRNSPWIRTQPQRGLSRASRNTNSRRPLPSAAAGPPLGTDTSTSAARAPAASAEASAARPQTPTTAHAASGRWPQRGRHDLDGANPALHAPRQQIQLVSQHCVLHLERGSC
jgi:hypothetical protein